MTNSSSAVARPDSNLERVRSALAIAVMLSGGVLMALIFTVMAPVLPEIAEQFRHSGGVLVSQLIMSAPGLGVIAGGLTGGLLVDKLGRRPVLLMALLVYAAAGSSPLYLDSAWGMIGGRLVLGWSGATIQAAIIGLIGARFGEPHRTKMIGYEAALGGLAGVLALLASGAVAEATSWRAPAALYLFALVVFAVAAFAIPRGPNTAAAGLAEPAVAETMPRLAPLAIRLAPLLLLIPLLYAAHFMVAIQMPFLLAENGVVGPAAKSRLMVVAITATVLGAASSGWIRERLGEKQLFGLTLMLMGAGEVVLSFAHSAPMTILGGLIAGLGGGMLMPTLMSIAVSRAPDPLRGRAAGLVYTFAYVGEFLNPIIFGSLALRLGIHGVFLAVGSAIATIGIAATAVAQHERLKRKPPPPSAASSDPAEPRSSDPL